MGETLILRNEDKLALPIAVALHVLVVAALVIQPVRTDVLTPPPRMTVSLATEVGLEAASPDPVAESRAAIAPVLGEEPAPEAVSENTPQPEARPVVVQRPTPAERPRPAERPVTRRPPPAPTSPQRDRSRPDREQPARTASAERGGGSRIGEDFLAGRGDSTRTDETRAPAATFGRAERAALSSAITRQLRPHWNAPSGVDAEKLVSIVSWRLNKDGSLNGRPTCRTEAGSITDLNKPQAPLHCERAIRAVQLAAPFDLPEQFYDRWNDLEWQFDRRL